MNWLDFIVQVALFFVVFKLGQWSVILPLRSAIRDLATKRGIDVEKLLREELADLEKTVADTDPRTEELMEIERVDGTYYAYGADGRFLAQGRDFRTMFETVKQRFPGQSFRINDYRAKFTDDEADRLVKTLLEVYSDKETQAHDKNR